MGPRGGALRGYSRNRFRFHIRQTYVLHREDRGWVRLKGTATYYEFHTVRRFLLSFSERRPSNFGSIYQTSLRVNSAAPLTCATLYQNQFPRFVIFYRALDPIIDVCWCYSTAFPCNFYCNAHSIAT